MNKSSPPQTLQELLARANMLTGKSLGEIASITGFQLPSNATHAKGMVGEMLESLLGATAGTESKPDFPELGVELKSIPQSPTGKILESTFVCTLNMDEIDRAEWSSSRVLQKLSCVLWIPIETIKGSPLSNRRIGCPVLWRPRAEEIAQLYDDWILLMGKMALGRFEELTGHLGKILQLRPKAPNGKARISVWGPEGEYLDTIPKGFYLRANFTQKILRDNVQLIDVSQ